MRKLSIQEIQEIQLNLMNLVHKVCTENDIKYFLISGSCLGAVRHKGFIPWDDDIDIGMMRSDYEKFTNNFYQWFDSSLYFLQNEFTDTDFSVPLSRICIKGTLLEEPWFEHLRSNKSIFMDIFPLDNVPDQDNLRRKQNRYITFYNIIINRKIYSKSPSKIKNMIKWGISKLLTPIPLKILIQKRKEVITRYDKIQTTCVCSMASKYGYKKHIMDRSIYGDGKKLEFEKNLFYFPSQYEKHLKKLFGTDFMKLPPIEKRDKPTEAYII